MTHDFINETIEKTVKSTVEQYRKICLPDQEYLNTKQAAAYLGFSTQRLEIWRLSGGGPPYTKMLQAVRYKKSDLDQFMAAHRKLHTAEEVRHDS